MSLFKSRDDRFNGIVDVVEKHFDKKAAFIVQNRIDNLGSKREAVGNAISLGSRSDSSAAETERRNAIRAVLFLLFVEGNQPLSLAPSFKARYEVMGITQLVKELQGRLPVLLQSPKRDAWDPHHFSGVTNPPPAGFRYIVFGMRNDYTGRGISYDTILDDPYIVKSFAISTSVICEGKVPTYFPYGLILDVPKENIVSTSKADQAFKNYSSDDTGLKSPAQLNDMRGEIARVGMDHGLLTPDEILAATTKQGGDFGYNEIVVLGTGPTMAQVNVKGFFMKLDSKGNRYKRSVHNDRRLLEFVTDDIYQKMKKSTLPIVEITDAMGGSDGH